MNSREKAQAIERVLDYMGRLSAADLVELGGEDLSGRNSKKAAHVERVWALMARLGITHIDVFPDFVERAVRAPGLGTTKATPQNANAKTIVIATT